jgi:hypothetical protein
MEPGWSLTQLKRGDFRAGEDLRLAPLKQNEGGAFEAGIQERAR